MPVKILVSPLNWGLGHATRCIPVIEGLLNRDVEVVLAAEGRPGVLLKKTFPELRFLDFPQFDMSYPERGSFLLSMMKQSGSLLKSIIREHRIVQRLIAEENITGIISDNRFGMYSKSLPSVIITHQLEIQFPVLQKGLNSMNHYFLKKFDKIWVPDLEGRPNLSGNLSQAAGIAKRFVGPLSRFSRMANKGLPEGFSEIGENYILAIISGPEPQRTLFEEIILKQLKSLNMPAVAVLGKPEEKLFEQQGVVYTVSHLGADALGALIQNCALVIARSGYSTVMDVCALGKRAVFVPTPGQTEQEYLAAYYRENGWFYSVSQSDFNLEEVLNKHRDYPGVSLASKPNLLEETLDKFVVSCMT